MFLGIQGDEGSWVITLALVGRNYESFVWNPRRWGGPRDYGSSILQWWEEIMKFLFGIQGDEEAQGTMVHQSCNGGKKLWKSTRKKLGEKDTQSSKEMKKLKANCEAWLHVFGSL